MSATYIPPPSLPLAGGTLTGRLNSVGITDLGTELFGDQTPVTALGLAVDQMAVGYNPTNFPAGSTIGFAVASSGAPSSTAGGTFVLFQVRNSAIGTNPMSVLQGLKFDAIYGSSGAITAVRGAQGTARATGGATVTQLEGVSSQLFASNSSAVTSGYSMFVSTPSIATSGTIATAYGVFINGMSTAGVVTGIAFYAANATDTSRFGGSVSIGKTTAPAVSLDVNGMLATKVYTVATLPTAPIDGARAYISDSALALGFGTAVGAGGGTNHMPVYYNTGTAAWMIG